MDDRKPAILPDQQSLQPASGPPSAVVYLDDEQDVAGLDGAEAMHLAQERTAPQALHGERAGIVAKIQCQDRPQAGVAQHLHQALQHLAW